MNLTDLGKTTKNFAGWRVNPNLTGNAVLSKIITSQGTNVLTFGFTIKGSKADQHYNTWLSFSKVNLHPADEQEAGHFLIHTRHGSFAVKQFDWLRQPVKVRCSCRDFYFRFAVWNHKAGVLFGRIPPKYKRKTTTRPEVNPQHIPGICKHIQLAAKVLISSRGAIVTASQQELSGIQRD